MRLQHSGFRFGTFGLLGLTLALTCSAGAQATAGKVVVWSPADAKYGNTLNKDWSKDPMFQLLEKKTNLDIEWVIVPWDNYDERLRTAAASGRLPDLISYLDHNNKNLINQFVKDKLITPLDTDLASTLPTVLREYARLPNSNELKIDGRIYMRPTTWGSGAQPNAGLIHIRQDLLRPLGLKQPATFPELFAYLKACTSKTGMKGMAFSGAAEGGLGPSLNAFAGAYGLPYQGWVKVGDGYGANVVQPGMKSALLLFRQMVSQGLADPAGWDIKNATDSHAKFTAGQACASLFNGGPIDLETQAKLETSVKGGVQLTLPALSANGQTRGYTPEPQWWSASFISNLPSNNRKGAARLLEYMTSAEWARLAALGVEGRDYKRVNGKVELIEEARLRDGFLATQQELGIHPLSGGIGIDFSSTWRDRFANDIRVGWGKTPAELARYKTWQSNASKYQVASYGAFASTPAWAKFSPTGNELWARASVGIVRAKTDQEAGQLFDKFVKDWFATGGTQATQEMSAYLKTLYK